MNQILYYIIACISFFIIIGIWIAFPDVDVWLKITTDSGWFIVLLNMIQKIFDNQKGDKNEN